MNFLVEIVSFVSFASFVDTYTGKKDASHIPTFVDAKKWNILNE